MGDNNNDDKSNDDESIGVNNDDGGADDAVESVADDPDDDVESVADSAMGILANNGVDGDAKSVVENKLVITIMMLGVLPPRESDDNNDAGRCLPVKYVNWH